jgi:hypothetical protein
MKQHQALLGLILLAAASSAAAEDLGTRSVNVVRTPDADLRTGFGGAGVVISATSDSSEVGVTFGRSWDSRPDYALNNWTLKLSAPLDKGAGEGTFVTEGGLSNSTAVTFAYNRVKPPPSTLTRLVAARDVEIQKGRDACAKKALAAKAPEGFTTEEQATFATLAKAKAEDCKTKYMRALIEDGDIPSDVAAQLTDEDFRDGATWTFNVTGSIGYQAFDYRSPADFAEQSTDRTPYSAAISFGVMPPRTSAFLTGGVEYKQDYVDAQDRTLCRPPPASGPQECVTGPFDRPVSKKVFDAFDVWRVQGQVGRPETPIPYGLELKAAYDFENQVSGLGAALYLVPDKDKALRGGVRLLWQSDDDDPTTKDKNFTVGVFVGSAF